MAYRDRLVSIGNRIMTRTIAFVACLVLSLGNGAAIADATPPPDNVLFVGNSFTYYNNSVHNHYRALVSAAGIETGRTRIMTISGGRLPEHEAGLESMLDAEDWDVVVLQGHSRGPIGEDTGPPFRDAARKYAAMIRARGAEPVFFMTWAYTGQPGMTAALESAYVGIGDELGARVAPVGIAFEAVTAERPSIELRIQDQRHPSLAGTYLAACVFFAVLQGRSPEGLSYDAGLGPEAASYLQAAAWQVVDGFGPVDH